MSYYKKKKDDFTLRKHFEAFKLIHKLRKKRSPMIIEFLSEPGEDWFVEVIRYKRTDEVIIHHCLITQDQVEDWIERDIRIMGYQNFEDEKK